MNINIIIQYRHDIVYPFKIGMLLKVLDITTLFEYFWNLWNLPKSLKEFLLKPQIFLLSLLTCQDARLFNEKKCTVLAQYMEKAQFFGSVARFTTARILEG